MKTSNGPPSIERADPLGWAIASAISGLALAVVALIALWRSAPGLPAPIGPLSMHMAYWAALAANQIHPHWFEASAATYAKWWASSSVAERWGIGARVALAACMFIVPWFLLAPSHLRPRDRLIHLRGSRRHHGKEALTMLRVRLAARCRRRPDHAIAPGAPYPADLWTRHVLVLGGVGSGKSTAMKPLIDKIVISGEQLLLFDPKSEFRICFEQIFCSDSCKSRLNPFGWR